MSNMSTKYHVGTIHDNNVDLAVSLIVEEDGIGHVQMIAHNRADGESVLCRLGEQEFQDLIECINNIEVVMAQYKRLGRLRRWKIFYETEMTVEKSVGSVQSLYSILSIAIHVNRQGDGFLSIHAFDTEDRQGALVYVNQQEYGNFLSIMRNIDNAIQSSRASGELNLLEA